MTLLFYLVDLTTKTQTNLFTGKQRPITSKQSITKINPQHYNSIRAYYNVPQTQLIYFFEEKDAAKLISCLDSIQAYAQSKKITT